jgi:hypothetical protein
LLNDYQNPGILILNQMRLVIILNTTRDDPKVLSLPWVRKYFTSDCFMFSIYWQTNMISVILSNNIISFTIIALNNDVLINPLWANRRTPNFQCFPIKKMFINFRKNLQKQKRYFWRDAITFSDHQFKNK